ncbi:epididymal sperm-binding protein 1 isoform X2 [Protobothrops mucrosquamatus]|uniref:epididymal sperm-binding protein 1 isoform X2 n=1 Tax=Protobothrops mucrosquamatus TaxID=103944 RepID=UPI000775736D|nr:epididymal sperm-binding protein 1 isoform X2 [Protobothrops mucrosquamatus]
MNTIIAFILFSTLLQSLLAAVPPPCVFPFIYKGKPYNSCTEVASQNRPWCATTANFDTSPQWKYCATKEYGGNSDGKQCVFPFTYKKRTYYTCTNEDAEIGRFWCATTGSYDNDEQWSYCADTKLLPCTFPFTFSNKIYHYCTKDGAYDGQLWCATTANYERDRKWRACATEEYEGNSKGKRCFFPFIYNGNTFNSCTNQNSDNGRFWCSVTRNYDADRQWSYCDDTRL